MIGDRQLSQGDKRPGGMHRLARDRARHPVPRLWSAVMRWSLGADEVANSIVRELNDEFAERVAGDTAKPRSWYRREALSVAGRALLDRLRGRGWSVRPANLGGSPPAPGPRRTRPFSFASGITDDIVLALRMLRRAPGYCATAVITLALVIGANVAMYTVFETVLLRPLLFPADDELVRISRVYRGRVSEGGVSYPDFLDWQRAAPSMVGMAAWTRASDPYLGAGVPEMWHGIEATPELFEVLGVPALVGRTLRADLDEIASPVVVLSYTTWRSRFAADPDVIGRQVRLGAATLTVVGVMPEHFVFPVSGEQRPQYWMPLGRLGFLENRLTGFLEVVGRLDDAGSLARARSELRGLAAAIDSEHQEEPEAFGAEVQSMRAAEAGDAAPLLLAMMGAAAFVLAVACANLANLGLARAVAQRRDLLIRRAIGARRGRVARQLLIESWLLSVTGGLAGLAVAATLIRLVRDALPPEFPRLAELGLDGGSWAFAALVSLGSGLAVGLLPALQLAAAKRDGASHLRNRRGTVRLQKGLVVSQLSLALVLLAGAGLLINSLAHLWMVETGFDPTSTLTMQISLPRARYPSAEATTAFFDEVRRRALGMPGVVGVGSTTHLPFSPSELRGSYRLEGEGVLPFGEYGVAGLEIIDADYLDAMKIALLAGRAFESADGVDAPAVALVNQAFAARWVGESPLGKRFTFDIDSAETWHTVVGVVEPVVRGALDREVRPEVYLYRPQALGSVISGRFSYVVVRTRTDPEALVEPLRRQIAAIDAELPVTEIRTLSGLITDSAAGATLRTVVLSGFSALALTLALVGIYGVLSFVVAQRTYDIGVRMVLGATAVGIRRRVLAEAAYLLAASLLVGGAATLGVTRVIASLLYGVTPTDPVTLAAVALIVSFVALGAAFAPARRASAVDPGVALRRY